MTSTNEQLFPTLQPEASEALGAYIVANTPRGYVHQSYKSTYHRGEDTYLLTEASDSINKTAGFVAFVGVACVGIAGIDYIATAIGESNLNVNEYRDANTNTMNIWISGIEDDIARHPNEVTV